MKMQKRVIAVHDISCIGKCSLTVALPILSAAGIETGVLPTAVLSTHTGGFQNPALIDLTDNLKPILSHWQSLDLRTDAIYTGYLGSFRQLEIVSKMIDTFRTEDTCVFIDPVMADNGKLYGGFSEDFPAGMAALCAKADVIVPNLTEAALMLGESYRGDGYSREYVEDLLVRLTDPGPKVAVTTGISFEKGRLGAMSYDRTKGIFAEYYAEKIDGYFHGTGDVFASALLAALMNGVPLDGALKIAVNYTVGCIKRTAEAGTDRKYGVNFEAGLERLAHDIRGAAGRENG